MDGKTNQTIVRVGYQDDNSSPDNKATTMTFDKRVIHGMPLNYCYETYSEHSRSN